jgi:hypothetical protein
MKTQGIKWRRGLSWHGAAFLFLLVASSFNFVACDNGGGSPPVAPIPIPCTVNCGWGTGNMITKGLGTAYTGGGQSVRFEVALEFRGNFGTTYNPSMPNLYASYSGPVTATGWMTVFGNDSYTCPLFPGQYSIRSTQQGMWGGNGIGSSASFSGVRVEAVGAGHTLSLLFPNNFVSPTIPTIRAISRAENFDFYIGNVMIVEAVDGFACPPIVNEYVLNL